MNDILKLKPNGIFLSNGPGDPKASDKNVLKILKNLQKIKKFFQMQFKHQLNGLKEVKLNSAKIIQKPYLVLHKVVYTKI